MFRRLKHIVKYLIDERYRTKILLRRLNKKYLDNLKRHFENYDNFVH